MIAAGFWLLALGIRGKTICTSLALLLIEEFLASSQQHFS